MSEEIPAGLVFDQPIKRGRPPDGPDGMNKAARRKKKKDDKAEEKADLERPPQSAHIKSTSYKGPATPRAEEKKGIFEGEKRAVDVAFHWSDVKPAGEKQWVIDQMLRAMLGGLGYRDYKEQYKKEWDIEWDQGSEPEWENEDEYSEPDDKQQEYDESEDADSPPGDENNGESDSGSDSNGEFNDDEVPF